MNERTSDGGAEEEPAEMTEQAKAELKKVSAPSFRQARRAREPPPRGRPPRRRPD